MDFQDIPCEIETQTDDHSSLCHEISGLQTFSHHGNGADKKELPVVLVIFGSQKQLVDMRIVYKYCVPIDMIIDNHNYRALITTAPVVGCPGNLWPSRRRMPRGNERPEGGRSRAVIARRKNA